MLVLFLSGQTHNLLKQIYKRIHILSSTDYSCLDPFQSDFRPDYRTEITLVALLDDLH